MAPNPKKIYEKTTKTKHIKKITQNPKLSKRTCVRARLVGGKQWQGDHIWERHTFVPFYYLTPYSPVPTKNSIQIAADCGSHFVGLFNRWKGYAIPFHSNRSVWWPWTIFDLLNGHVNVKWNRYQKKMHTKRTYIEM